MLYYAIYILVFLGICSFGLLFFRFFACFKTCIYMWLMVVKIWCKLYFRKTKQRIISFYKQWPYKIQKGNPFYFKIENDVYIMEWNIHYPKSLFDLVPISDETSSDVGNYILSRAGPQCDFYGNRVTPKTLGFKYLYINGWKIHEDDPIQLLKYVE